MYVLSAGNNQEEISNNTNSNPTSNLLHADTLVNSNNSGIVWKISYQAEEEAKMSGNNASNIISNGTGNNNNTVNNATSNLTTPPPPPSSSSSSNDTDSIGNSTINDDSLLGPPPPSSFADGGDSTSNNSSGSRSINGGTDSNIDSDSGLSAPPPPPPSGCSPEDATNPPGASTPPLSPTTPPDDGETTTPPPPPPSSESPTSSPPPSTTQPPPRPPPTIPDNEAPVATDQTIAIEEDLSSVEIELLATDNNQDDILNLEFAIVSEPAHGELGEIRQGEEAASSTANDENSDTSNSSPTAKATVTYTPDENYNGQDSFQFRVNDDSDANSNIARVTIDIASVNDAPIAEDDAATTDQGTPVGVDVLANDMDVDIVQESNGGGGRGDDNPIILDSISQGSIQGGSIIRITSGSDDGEGTERGVVNEKIEYTPAEGFFGIDEFSYTIVDTNGATASATVTVTVKQIVVAEPEEGGEEEELPNNTIEGDEDQQEEEEEIESENDDESNDD